MRYFVNVRNDKSIMFNCSNYRSLQYLLYGLCSIDPFVGNILIYDKVDQVYLDEELVWLSICEDGINHEN